MIAKKIFFFLICILLVQSISAQYIAGDIYIRENGDVNFFIESDVDLNLEGIVFSDGKLRGTTSALTSKNGKKWSFTLNFENYETILLDVHLPNNLKSINSISGVESIIDFDEKIISLIDGDVDLNFLVEYELKEKDDLSWIYSAVFLILLIIIVYLFFKSLKKKKEKLDYVFPLINDNEKKIIEVLMKRPMRQKEVRKKLDIPKASFSRYVFNLEKKKLIVREGEGKNKILKLK